MSHLSTGVPPCCQCPATSDSHSFGAFSYWIFLGGFEWILHSKIYTLELTDYSQALCQRSFYVQKKSRQIRASPNGWPQACLYKTFLRWSILLSPTFSLFHHRCLLIIPIPLSLFAKTMTNGVFIQVQSSLLQGRDTNPEYKVPGGALRYSKYVCRGCRSYLDESPLCSIVFSHYAITKEESFWPKASWRMNNLPSKTLRIQCQHLQIILLGAGGACSCDEWIFWLGD